MEKIHKLQRLADRISSFQENRITRTKFMKFGGSYLWRKIYVVWQKLLMKFGRSKEEDLRRLSLKVMKTRFRKLNLSEVRQTRFMKENKCTPHIGEALYIHNQHGPYIR